MTFLVPGWLALLAALAALAVAYLLAQRRRGRYAVRFATLPLLEKVIGRGPGWRRHLPAAAFGLATLGMVLALARPVVPVDVPRERATVVVAVDTSASMRATDVEPTRIAAATAAAGRFVDDLPETFNVGLVTFSGTSAVAVPPGTDRGPIHDALTDPSSERAPPSATLCSPPSGPSERGRRLGFDAPPAAAQPPPARIVLLSDGDNTAGSPLADAVRRGPRRGGAGLHIAYGTPTGTIPDGGRTLRVPVDAAALAELAADTGGQSYTAASGEGARRRLPRHRLLHRLPHRGTRDHLPG